MEDIHIPENTSHCPDFANFSPKLFNKKKSTKNIMANTKGVPSPPLRIMEPKGAPIKKSTKQAKDKVNSVSYTHLTLPTILRV